MAIPEPDSPKPPDPAPSPGKEARETPEWLTGASEGTERRDPPSERPTLPPARRAAPPKRAAKPAAGNPAPAEDAPETSAAKEAPEETSAAKDTTGETSAAKDTPAKGPVAWKAAASSIPRLSQVVAVTAESAADPFPGFAQDSLVERASAPGAESAAHRLLATSGDMPIGGAPRGARMAWLDALQSIPKPLLIAAGAVAVLGIVTLFLLGRGGEPSVSLAQIRQHPEAYEGRAVRVSGEAGEAFMIGNSFVFDLRQSRDTIVVYSRSRHPSLHESVAVHGTVSIGYMDGAPRVALLEDPSN
ncbi:MAG: hypothetical protein HYR74_09330 [Candidatus Eisenbacteria bacterium]|nr:hypothetical protein [Candidatus Eisenbacteria bacterium]